MKIDMAGIVATVIVTLGIFGVATLVVKIITKIFNQDKYQKTLGSRLLKNILVSAVYTIAVLISMEQIPALSRVANTILAGSGILALGISLSAQESLSNILSGMFITIFKPFDVGDRVRLISNNITGTIEDITLRHTVIKTFTNTRVVVPNSIMNKETIENSNYADERASNFLDIEVSYECNLDRAMEIIAEEIAKHPNFIDIRTDEDKKQGVPLVQVFVRDLGESGIGLRASVWTNTVGENFKTCSDLRLAIKKRFDLEGIEIPYKKVTISNLNELKN